MMPKFTKKAVGAILTSYGGMTPYRQRLVASRCFISREFNVDGLPKGVARPEDKLLGFYEAIQRRSAVRVSATDTPLDCLQTTTHLACLFALRFLIISEVCLTGEKLNHSLNVPVSLAVTGFVGV